MDKYTPQDVAKHFDVLVNDLVFLIANMKLDVKAEASKERLLMAIDGLEIMARKMGDDLSQYIEG